MSHPPVADRYFTSTWTMVAAAQRNSSTQLVFASTVSYTHLDVYKRQAFDRFHDLDEGGLTRIKVALVSGASLSDVAERLGFADVIVFGSSETGTGRRGLHSALENVYEAVVAALFLDGGIEAAEGFVRATLIPRMSADMAREPENPKSALQEKLQEDGITPTYKLVETQGPPHDRTFVCLLYTSRCV